MRDRRDLPSVLTRALLMAAAPRARQGQAPANDLFTSPGAPPSLEDLTAVSDEAHALLSDLIILLQLELEGLVGSPLNDRSRARPRLGSPSRSRILAEWPTRPHAGTARDLFPRPAGRHALPIASGPEPFFLETLEAIRGMAGALDLDASDIEEMIRWLLPVIARCAPEDDPVGWIHAHALRHRLLRGPGHRLRFQVDRERGRSHGVLYTPPPLTEALVSAVLGEWERAAGGESLSLFGATSRREAQPLRILDPACGSGQFLLSIARRLLRSGNGSGAPRRPDDLLGVFRAMHGVDIDPQAATLAALNLSLQAVRAVCRSQEADPQIVVRWLQEQLGPGFPWFLGGQVHQGNALMLAAKQDVRTFRWAERFQTIFGGDRPGFDIVIGNPPWVSYGLRDRAGVEEEESAYLRGLFTYGAQYKLSLYPLFIELALRLTRPGGLHGFLVPDSFFTGRHFSKIRAHILETCHPILICLVESGPWPGVHVGHTAFYCVRRLPSPDPPPQILTCALRLQPPSRRARGERDLPLFAGDADRSRPVLVDPETFRRTPHHAFRIFRDEKEQRLVAEMERQPLRLDELIESYSGLIARYGQETVIGPREGPFVLGNRQGAIVFRDPDPAGRWLPALQSGAEVEPYKARWRGGALYIPADRDGLRKVYKSGFDLERYAGSKLFLRQTGDRLVAARDLRNFYCLNNVHILSARSDPGIDLRFLCGLLMSDPIQRYYQIVALEAGRPLAQVDLATVETLPVPCDAGGAPYGSGTAARAGDSRDDLRRRIADIVDAGRAVPVADLARDADLAGGLVCRLVERLEETEDEQSRRALQETLDRVIYALFGMAPVSGEGVG